MNCTITVWDPSRSDDRYIIDQMKIDSMILLNQIFDYVQDHKFAMSVWYS